MQFGIDERRAKFRQDLISESRPLPDNPEEVRGRSQQPHGVSEAHLGLPGKASRPLNNGVPSERFRRQSMAQARRTRRSMSRSPGPSLGRVPENDGESMNSSRISLQCGPEAAEEDEIEADEAAPQDIEEVWFAGGHGVGSPFFDLSLLTVSRTLVAVGNSKKAKCLSVMFLLSGSSARPKKLA